MSKGARVDHVDAHVCISWVHGRSHDAEVSRRSGRRVRQRLAADEGRRQGMFGKTVETSSAGIDILWELPTSLTVNTMRRMLKSSKV